MFNRIHCVLQVTLLEEKLKEYCKMPFRIKVYPEQVHGFVQTKPADMKPDNVLYIEEAQMDMMDWLNKYLMFWSPQTIAIAWCSLPFQPPQMHFIYFFWNICRLWYDPSDFGKQTFRLRELARIKIGMFVMSGSELL